MTDQEWGPNKVYEEVMTPYGTFGFGPNQILTFAEDADGDMQPVTTDVQIVTAPVAAEPEDEPEDTEPTRPAAPKAKPKPPKK
jgi:hypothetical protein